MQGLHLTADIDHCQCQPHWLTDAHQLLQACEAAAAQAGLTPVARLGHTFPATAHGPGGVTATVLLAESHLCVHTWPETNSATLDVYVCNLGGDHSQHARQLMAALLALLAPTHSQQHALWRGQPAAPALLLAAGRGERMRPLTDATPKPLLPVRGQPLLAWHVQALANAGCQHLVVNTAWLGEQISSFFATQRLIDGTFKLSINGMPTPVFTAALSHEQADFGAALETAGGIARALPLLFPAAQGQAPNPVFWVAAGDVYVPGFAFSQASVNQFRAGTALAHLWLVPNPAHNPQGDFGIAPNGLAQNLPATDTTTPRHTYSTIGLFRPELFGAPWCDMVPGNPTGIRAALGPLLRQAMDAGRVTAELYEGEWTDVGTPERLAALNA